MTSVADTMWLWGHPAGTASRNSSLLRTSALGPVEGAQHFGVRNLFLVPWRERMPLEQTATAADALREVGWSVEYGRVGSEQRLEDELDALVALSARHSNMSRVVLDDFFEANGRESPGPPRLDPRFSDLSPERLASTQERLRTAGLRPLSVWMVIYTYQLHPNIKPYLDAVDGVMLWFWHQRDLEDYDQRLEAWIGLTEGKRRMLGCYLFDFGANRPADPDLALWQLDRQLELTREGTVEGTCLHTNAVADVGLRAPDAAKRWMADHGPRSLGRDIELPTSTDASVGADHDQ